jgi:hypothetical protein
MILLDASHIFHIILLGKCPFLLIQRVQLLEAKYLEERKWGKHMLKIKISIILNFINNDNIKSREIIKMLYINKIKACYKT